MSTRLILRIQERERRLTASERKLAQVMLERRDDALTLTATELAKLAGVSKATTARFFRSLGYTDFNEARLQAREERNRTEPYRYSVAGSDQIVLGQAISAHLDLEMSNLTRTFEELRSDRLKQAAKVLAAAPRVWWLGLGVEEGSARYGKLLLQRLRPNVLQLGTINGAWAEDLAMTGPRDALVLLTLPPRPRILKPILAHAKTSRMDVVTLCDAPWQVQAQRFSSVVLPCHVASFGLGPSATAMVSATRLLAIAYAAHSGDSAQQRAEIIANIQEELDDLG